MMLGMLNTMVPLCDNMQILEEVDFLSTIATFDRLNAHVSIVDGVRMLLQEDLDCLTY